MHPAYSVIIFTTFSGAGYGLLAALALFGITGGVQPDRWLGVSGFGIALVMITGGLLTSTFHLGHPERAWRALSQWRSSWLSREGVLAIATYVPALLLAVWWVVLGSLDGAANLFAALTIVFSIMTVAARSPVRSAVYLISALLAVAGLFFLLQAEFVGAAQILVYVGGIMVLFLFVILLVNVERAEQERRSSRQWRTGVALGVVLSIELGFLVARGSSIFGPTAARQLIEGRSENTESVGELLYTSYLLPFEIASVLLLVAIVGAVVLAKKDLRNRA